MLTKFLGLNRSTLIHVVTVFLVFFGNIALFRHFFEAYPFSAKHVLYFVLVVLLLAAIIDIILHLLCVRRATKPVLITILLMSALTSYFMNTYNTVLDATMIRNIFQTNINEAGDLFSGKLVLYILFSGILPSVYVYKVRIAYQPLKEELLGTSKFLLIAILLSVSQVFIFGKFYSSFLREHKDIRVYANPAMYIYSFFNYAALAFDKGDQAVAGLGDDAKVSASDIHRELIILVVGETARADKFSLNGYQRKTNPLLEKEEVYSFYHFQSCGTSTAISVPCMFSHLREDNFTVEKGKKTENLLDVLKHAGIHVLWRDNNSDSKNVALRVSFEDFRTPERNPVCDPECRDIGMLNGLQDYIDSNANDDIVVVLHQMGNHGPAYYQRYPASFEQFTPVCHTNLLEECSEEEITNTYDNAILYTDYFLSETIQLLKKNSGGFETAMIYISDHGESLGENGVYLHGMPNFMAPAVQRNVGAIFWFGKSYEDIDRNALAQKTGGAYSHDNLFHTILGLLEIRTSVYNRNLDIIDHLEDRPEAK
ncbi:MAG: phosphoethanolamine--lipid A transferase [Gammaproteobacteria bacterium]|nr:phosphoethanolamine--lipid A transferase [Gammaproteobacteria bacterium]